MQCPSPAGKHRGACKRVFAHTCMFLCVFAHIHALQGGFWEFPSFPVGRMGSSGARQAEHPCSVLLALG